MSALQTDVRLADAVPCDVAVERSYWQSCREHAMRLQECDDCGNFRFYPGYVCDQCGSSDMTWKPVSGRGRVHTCTVVHRPAVGFTRAPYVWALIELDEGPVMASNVVGCPVDDVRIGMAVEVVYDDVTPEWTVPRFRPAEEGA